MSFKDFLLEMEDEHLKFVSKYNPKKDYSKETFQPFSSAETKKGLEKLHSLPKAEPNRRWFDTPEEIDTRDIGFVHSQTQPWSTLGAGPRACGIAKIPISKIIAHQSSIKIAGMEAYLNNKRLILPVVKQYIGRDFVSVVTGHTRIAAMVLAGRIPEVVVVFDGDNPPSKRRPTKYYWSQ